MTENVLKKKILHEFLTDFSGMVLVVDIRLVPLSRISAALLIVVVVALWHKHYPSTSSSVDFRTIHRSCGDDFLTNYLTSKNYSLEDFHVTGNLRGQGMYDLIREMAAPLLKFVPRFEDRRGDDRTLVLPQGKF